MHVTLGKVTVSIAVNMQSYDLSFCPSNPKLTQHNHRWQYALLRTNIVYAFLRFSFVEVYYYRRGELNKCQGQSRSQGQEDLSISVDVVWQNRQRVGNHWWSSYIHVLLVRQLHSGLRTECFIVSDVSIQCCHMKKYSSTALWPAVNKTGTHKSSQFCHHIFCVHIIGIWFYLVLMYTCKNL